MNATRKKSLADVWRRKGRTLLVILGIFVGVSGLTGINFIQDTIANAFAYSVGNQAAQPNIIMVVDTLDAALLPSLQATPNVQRIQYETTYDTSWHVTVAPGTVPITISSYPDLHHIPLTPFQLTSGRYPGVGEIVMEYGDLGLQRFSIGDTVTVDTAQGSTQLHVVGLARTPGVNPATSGDAQAYMSDAGLHQAFAAASVPSGAKGPALTQQIAVKVQAINQVSATATALQAILQAHHVTVTRINIPGSRTLPLAQINGVFTLLRILAMLAVVMSGFLILNTVTTLIAEQAAIIGTMKAIGGTRGAIMRGYLVSVGIYSLLGTIPAIGLGIGLGYPIASALAATIPLDVGPFAISWWLIPVSLAVGFGVPLLAALLPLWNGTRISVRDALAAYGVNADQGDGPLARMGLRLTWMPETTRLGLRGTFRKRWRAALTVLTLTLAGTTFLVVQTANASVTAMVASVNANVAADIDIRLHQPQPFAQLSTQVDAQPNVQHSERYDQLYGVATPWGSLMVMGFEPDTQIYHYHLLSGRWLASTDTQAVLLSDAAAAKAGLHVGDTLTVTDQGRQAAWTVIGILKQPTDNLGDIGAAVTSVTTLYAFTGLPTTQAATDTLDVLVQAHDRSPQAVDQLANELDASMNPAAAAQNGASQLDGSGARIITLQAETLRQQRSWFILYALLYSVALIVGIVGVLGLANVLIAAVLERRREIGMLRAMGATGWRVAQVFWIEGLALGGIAWFAGALLGLPLAFGFVHLLSVLVIPVDFVIDPIAFIVMLVAIVAIATLASFAPASQAARMRIATMLRYE